MTYKGRDYPFTFMPSTEFCIEHDFLGMVGGLQGYYSQSQFSAENYIGSAVALSLLRELGPVLLAFMVAGRTGSAIAAEIASMKVTEQIDHYLDLLLQGIRSATYGHRSRSSYNGVSRHVFRTNSPLGLFYDPSTFCFRRMMRILHCQLRREINAKELLQFRFILPPKSKSFSRNS